MDFSMKNTIFCDFCQFLIVQNMADHSAGSGQKHDFLLEMASQDPQNISTYDGLHYLMIRTNFENPSKIMIFDGFSKLVLIIK